MTRQSLLAHTVKEILEIDRELGLSEDPGERHLWLIVYEDGRKEGERDTHFMSNEELAATLEVQELNGRTVSYEYRRAGR